MEFFNLKHPEERAGFAEAARRGLASDQGLFHPASIPKVDAGAVLADAGLLAKKALEIAGRTLRIEPRAAEVAPRQAPAPRNDDDDDSDDGDAGPVHPVDIVEKVFRGRRVGGPRPAAARGGSPTGEPSGSPADTERSESWT